MDNRDFGNNREYSRQGIPYGRLKFIRALQQRIEEFIRDGEILPTLAFRSQMGTAPWLTGNKMMYRQRREACCAVLAWHFYLTSIANLSTQSATETTARNTGLGRRRVQRAKRDIIAAGIFERVFQGGGRLSQILAQEGWVKKIATFRVTLGALKQLKLFDFWKKVESHWQEKAAMVKTGVRTSWMSAAFERRGDAARKRAYAKTPPDSSVSATPENTADYAAAKREWQALLIRKANR